MRDIQKLAKYVGLSLLVKDMSVSPLKLQKILYYLQSWYMVFFGRENTLMADVPEAWVNGPVYPPVYYAYKDKVPGMCDHLTPSDFGYASAIDGLKEVSEQLSFTDEEQELIDSIILLYGAKSQNELIFYTHAEQPWVEQRLGLKPFERSDKKLSLDTMYHYYKERHEKNLAKA